MNKQGITYRPRRTKEPVPQEVADEDDAKLDVQIERGGIIGRRLMLGIAVVALTFSVYSGIHDTGDPFHYMRTGLIDPIIGSGEQVSASSDAWYRVNTAVFQSNIEKGPVRPKTLSPEVAAARYGFHLVDAVKCVSEVKSATSVNEILNSLKIYFGNYGITVDAGPDEIAKLGSSKLDDVKFGSSSTVEDFSALPVELIRLSGIKSIQLCKDTPDLQGLYNPYQKRVYLSANELVHGEEPRGTSGYPMNLAVAEGVDYAINGVHGSHYDMAYANGNGAQGDDPYNESHDPIKCWSRKVQFYADNFEGLNPNDVFGDGDKSELLLVRLDKHLPNVVHYLRDISTSKDWPVLGQ